MGFVDTIFGGASSAGPVDETEREKYAILLHAGPEDGAVASNGFTYALELADAGYEVEVFLDGAATQWPGAFEDDPDLPFAYDWNRLLERGLLSGACGYCANAFGATAACEAAGVDLLSETTEHAPAIATLADEGYRLLTIG